MVMRRYFPEDEQTRLLNAAKACADPLAQRDYHWMATLLLTGMRIGEFSRLTVPQVALALRTGWLVSRPEDCKGKRGNEYAVTTPLRTHLQALLSLADRQYDGNGRPEPLVPGRFGGHLTPRSYELRMKHWIRAAGLDDRASPHWMRHSRGMNIVRRSRAQSPGMAMKVAQAALGHASLKSTGVYLTLSREELAAELQAVDGGRVKKRQARALAEAAGVL